MKVRPAGIDTADPVPYTGRNGDGYDPRRRVTAIDVGGNGGPATGRGHPFYERLNQILNAAGFDAFVEKLCAPFYARMGRPSLAHDEGLYPELSTVPAVLRHDNLSAADARRQLASAAPLHLDDME